MTYGISPSRFDSPLSLFLSLSLYHYLSFSHSISPLSLSLSSLSFSLSYWFKKRKKGPPVSTPNKRRPGAHRDGQFSCRWRYFLDSWGSYRPRTWLLCQLVSCACFWASKVEAPMADGEGVGAIGAVDFWRLGPLGGRSIGRRLVLYSLLPRLFNIY